MEKWQLIVAFLVVFWGWSKLDDRIKELEDRVSDLEKEAEPPLVEDWPPYPSEDE